MYLPKYDEVYKTTSKTVQNKRWCLFDEQHRVHRVCVNLKSCMYNMTIRPALVTIIF